MNDFSNILDFSEKRVLITGSTRGIGKELAYGFKKAGAQLVLHGRNKNTLIPIAEELGADYVLAELSEHLEVEKMISELNQKYKKLHVLINNAAFEINKPIEDFSMDEFDKIFNVNIRSVFHLTKGVFPILKNADGAAVINISSIHQQLTYPNNGVYSMTKAAMEMFGKVLGVEWAPYNIRVNTLAPGAIATEMNKEIIDSIGRGKFSSWIGSGKIGTCDDVLYACLFLASKMSSYMTSETLYLDGALSKGLLPYGLTNAITRMRETLIHKDK